MRRPGTIFLFAIVVGALAAALVYRNFRGMQAELEAKLATSNLKTVEVFVADRTLPIGSRVTAKDVRTVRWPREVEPEGAVKDLTEAVDHVTRTTIDKNEPIVQAALVKEGAGLLPLIITEGMRAMSVKVDRVTGVSGFITPNSRVDVLIAGKPENVGNKGERSKLILQNVRVLATGTSIEQVEEKPVEVPTVTLLLSPQEAEKLTLAARHEPVRLALRNYRDEALVDTPGMNSAALFGPARERTVAVRAPSKSPRRPRYTVDVYLGDERTQQVLF